MHAEKFHVGATPHECVCVYTCVFIFISYEDTARHHAV